MWMIYEGEDGIAHYAKYLDNGMMITVCGPMQAVSRSRLHEVDAATVTCFHCLCVFTPEDLNAVLDEGREYWMNRRDGQPMKLTQWRIPIPMTDTV